MSKKTEALEVILGLMPNAKFIDKNGKDVTEDVKKSHNMEENEPKTHKSLTEQWKNRELKGGGYYVGLKNGEIFSDYFGGLEFSRIYNCEIKQILAPVPSYEEYKVLEYRSSRFSIKHFEKENAKLKELLKECRDEMNHYTELFTHKKTFEVLLTKINEVLND